MTRSFLIDLRNIHVVGPNKVLLISGSRNREARVVVGGRAFVPWPTQRCDFLSLELRTVIVESKKSATVQGVMVSATGVCQDQRIQRSGR